jgi:hypothetical protein
MIPRQAGIRHCGWAPGRLAELTFQKAIPSSLNLNWRVFTPMATLTAMSEQVESALPVGAFRPLVSSQPAEGTVRRAELSIARPVTKHSVVAAAFLMLYVAIYLAIGFLGISLIGRAWATVFE